MAQNAISSPYQFPKIKSKSRNNGKNASRRQSAKYSFKTNYIENRWMLLYVIVIFLLMIVTVLFSDQVTVATKQKTQMQDNIQKISIENDVLRDKINRSTTPEQLKELAKKFQMAPAEQTVQNINR